MAHLPAAKRHSGGQISADCIYTFDEAKARLGWGRAALRSARSKGLVVKYVGTRGFILGRDIIEFIDSQASTR